MNLDPIKRIGTTGPRKSFWDKARESVLSSRKIAGRNVTVTEHESAGTVINAAPHAVVTCFNVTFSGSVSGTAIITGAPCSGFTPAPVSATIAGPGSAYCVDSGVPVLSGCTDCGPGTDGVENDQSATLTITGLGGFCATPSKLIVNVVLLNLGGSFQLQVFASISNNIGNPPGCGGSCVIGLDAGQTYSLGPSPAGTHTSSYTGSVTGAAYNFTIVIA